MNPHFSVLNLNVFFLLQCFLAEYFISVAKIHESLGESQGSALQPLTFWAETSPTEGEVPVAAELSGRAARQGGVTWPCPWLGMLLVSQQGGTLW